MGIFLEWICYLERRRGMGQLLLRIFKDFSEFFEIYKAKEKISVGSRKRAFRKSCPQESVRSRKRVLKKAGAQGGGRLRKRALKKACAQESMPAGKRARKKACLRLARTSSVPLEKLIPSCCSTTSSFKYLRHCCGCGSCLIFVLPHSSFSHLII